jgi:hypothetical protein
MTDGKKRTRYSTRYNYIKGPRGFKNDVTLGDALNRRRMLARVRMRRLRAKRKQKRRDEGIEIRTYEELVEAMKTRRHELDLSQIDVDLIAGFQDGYTAKLEVGYKEGGRGVGAMSLAVWLDSIGARLLLVPR